MDVTATEQFLNELKEQRTSLLKGIVETRAGSVSDDVRKLAVVQGAIAAVEAEMAESKALGKSTWEEPSTTD